MNTNALEISHLRKKYKTQTEALKDVSLTIKEGDFFALLGANGAGKTTLIGILTGLVNKTSGTVKVYGHDLDTDIVAVKECLGVVPQEFNFNMFERVIDIVAVAGGYFGLTWKEAVTNAEDVLKRVGLWDKRLAMARTLSGGMKRRLMIARALVHKPKMLILDEPTAGVDVELRLGMWEYLRELNQAGTTILLTTHYLEEVEQMCRYAAIIDKGHIVHQDTVAGLKSMIVEDTYVITVKEMKSLNSLAMYKPVKIDEMRFEVGINRQQLLNNLLKDVMANGFELIDVHPKENRLEKLFLKILKRN